MSLLSFQISKLSWKELSLYSVNSFRLILMEFHSSIHFSSLLHFNSSVYFDVDCKDLNNTVKTNFQKAKSRVSPKSDYKIL